MSISKSAALPAAICAAVGACAAAGAFAFAAPAAAATSAFGCAASAVSATLATPPSTFSQALANPATFPCSSASQSSSVQTGAAPIASGATQAITHANTTQEGAGAGALAYAASVVIGAPGAVIAIAGAQSQATYACSSGQVISSSGSQVAGVTINGRAVVLPASTSSLKLAVGNGGELLINQETKTGTSLVRAAAIVELPGVGDVTIAQTVVAQTGDPCTGANTTSAFVQPCPNGSSYNAASGDCAIAGVTPAPIPVAAPFQGPTGGRVVALALARLTSKSACVQRGPGAPYVLVGSPGSGPIIGTGNGDRIIADSGDYLIEAGGGPNCIAVEGGNDVISAANGSDTVYTSGGSDQITLGNGRDYVQLGAGQAELKVGDGNDRIFAGPGLDAIRAGNGNDTIFAGAGSDEISAGNGNDRIVAAPGSDQITVGRGRDSIFTSLGSDQVRARGAGAHVLCNPAGQARVVLSRAAAAYARAHRCTDVVVR